MGNQRSDSTSHNLIFLHPTKSPGTGTGTRNSTQKPTQTHSIPPNPITMARQPNLFAFPTIDNLATTLRAYVIQCQTAGIQRHDSFKVAVSGGSLPKTLAQALLSKPTSPEDTVKFDKWEIFFADERAVPLDHEDSNYRLLKDELLDKIPAEMGKRPSTPSTSRIWMTCRSWQISTSSFSSRALLSAIASSCPSSTYCFSAADRMAILAVCSLDMRCCARQRRGLRRLRTPRSRRQRESRSACRSSHTVSRSRLWLRVVERRRS